MSTSERLRGFFRVNRGLILGLVALGVALYVSVAYVRQFLEVHTATSSPAATATVPIVVARTAIPAMASVSSSDLEVIAWPRTSVPPGAYSSTTSLQGAWSQEAIAAGVPLVSSEVFVPKTANILAARIATGDMATDVPLSSRNSVDGLIQPGNTVSLFTTITESNGKPVTEDFLNDVKVLAVNGSLTTSTTSTVGQSETLVVALPPTQIAMLLFAQEKGTVTAVLDAPNSVVKVPTPYGQLQWQVPIP